MYLNEIPYSMPQWVFAKLDPAAVRRDPNETQLFKSEQAGEGEYAGTDALVREILQNSMDAGNGRGPVRVRLALHSKADLPERRVLAEYFARLQSPLQHRDISFSTPGLPLLPNGFMVCEDFGTRGLGGDPLLAKDPIPGSSDRQDFFWFWRNIGRSGKTGDDLGRWGLGKTVYRAANTQVDCRRLILVALVSSSVQRMRVKCFGLRWRNLGPRSACFSPPRTVEDTEWRAKRSKFRHSATGLLVQVLAALWCCRYRRSKGIHAGVESGQALLGSSPQRVA